MKVTLAMVMSVDGKTTKWHDPHIYTWTSKEDQDHFFSLIEHHSAIVMGRKTYEAAKGIIKHTPDKIRMIVTTEPRAYTETAIPGQLEFTDKSPDELLSYLSKKGYTTILLVGGEQTNTAFLKANLVTDFLITIEPNLFGSGNSLISPSSLDIHLQLHEISKLNKRGTILLHYKMVKD